MQSPSSQSSLDQARQVCTSCKTKKRKCDKALPKCSSCSKRNLVCDYLRPEQNRNHASDQPWHGFPVDYDHVDVQSIDFPTILFLDPELLQHGQVEISQSSIPIPAHVLHLLGDIDEIRANASNFFESIHFWMPFISKKRFYDLYIRPPAQCQPDIVVLLLSIKLITTVPPEGSRNPRISLYNTVKHFYLEVEGSRLFSIPVLQAGVLLSLYELGHGIYPAAFLSIGACARYAQALGINGSSNANTRRALTLVDAEERRRVWWAIVILDRFVSIGCPGRPFAAADPSLDDLLPADDAEWDRGVVRSENSFALSSPMTSHMSRFALLCHAARLLGQVLHNLSHDPAIHDDAWMQLDRTLQSMLAAALNLDLPDYYQIAFIYNTLVALHAPWLFHKSTRLVENTRSQRARNVIQQISDTIIANLSEQGCFLGRDTKTTPPWGLFFAYRICVAHMHPDLKKSNSDEIVKSLRDTILKIDSRWNAAGIYIQLLEAQEIMNNTGKFR